MRGWVGLDALSWTSRRGGFRQGCGPRGRQKVLDPPQHAPHCGAGETPDRGVAQTQERERTGEGANTQRRGTRAPPQSQAHSLKEPEWVQPDDPTASFGLRLREEGGPIPNGAPLPAQAPTAGP